MSGTNQVDFCFTSDRTVYAGCPPTSTRLELATRTKGAFTRVAVQDHAKNRVQHPSRSGKKTLDNGPVGNALRAAYQDAVEEQVPSDLLDLLKKLS